MISGQKCVAVSQHNWKRSCPDLREKEGGGSLPSQLNKRAFKHLQGVPHQCSQPVNEASRNVWVLSCSWLPRVKTGQPQQAMPGPL